MNRFLKEECSTKETIRNVGLQLWDVSSRQVYFEMQLTSWWNENRQVLNQFTGRWQVPEYQASQDWSILINVHEIQSSMDNSLRKDHADARQNLKNHEWLVSSILNLKALHGCCWRLCSSSSCSSSWALTYSSWNRPIDREKTIMKEDLAGD